MLHTSTAVHRLLLFGTGAIVAVSCLLVGVSWRLAQGPIEFYWLADRVRVGLAGSDTAGHVSFDGLALAWEGFAKGVDHALDLRLTNFSIVDPLGRTLVAAPDAHLTLSFAGLLQGRIIPRSLEVDRADLAITRDATGTIGLGWASDSAEVPGSELPNARQLWDQLAHPASSDRNPGHGMLDQIQRIHFHDTTLTLRDRRAAMIVHASGVDLDLTRKPDGRISGSLEGRLSAGGELSSVTAALDVMPSASGNLNVRLTPFRPAALPLPPDLAFLADLDLPVSVTASASFGASLQPEQVRGELRLGQGQVHIDGRGAIPVRSGKIGWSAVTDALVISDGHFEFLRSSDGVAETADVSGTVTSVTDRLRASLTVGVDHIDVADIPQLWPVGVGKNARSWVIEHVTAGIATKGTTSLAIEADKALRGVELTKATGELDVSNATFTWLDNIPPVEQAEVHLRLADPDTLEVHLASGRQSITKHADGLAVRDCQMRIAGLKFDDQTADIHVHVEGPLTSAQALLSEPRLHLLSAHPIGINPTGGEVAAAIDLQFPLASNLRIDDVQIHATARLAHVRTPDVASGHELDDGSFDLGVDKDGLDLKGRATLATIPVTLDGRLEFDPHGPDDITQKIAVTGQPQAAQLDAAGLHVTDIVHGPIPMTLVMIERRGGAGSISVNADLTQATLAWAPLGWSKPPGSIVSAAATLSLLNDRLTRIDHFSARGDEVTLNGSANLSNGRIRSVLLDNFQLGRSEGNATVHVSANDEIDVAVRSSQIDLSAKLAEKSPDRAAPVAAGTPVWRLDARFDRAILANGESASDVQATAAGAGDAVRALDVVGETRGGAGFSIKLRPEAEKGHLSVEAKDAGRFLRGLDAVRGMQSGHLRLDGAVDNAAGFQPMSGTAVIDNVVVRNSPVLATLLQAITVYGVADVLRGPGLMFTHVVIPFRYDGTTLSVDDAHAANSSLGLTAQGRIGLASGQVTLNGTIVPAYFFNAALGKLPLVGKLFSPEKGGGVFAARFALDGSIEDPRISINPVSALTPGFLREIFGVFDAAPDKPGVTKPR